MACAFSNKRTRFASSPFCKISRVLHRPMRSKRRYGDYLRNIPNHAACKAPCSILPGAPTAMPAPPTHRPCQQARFELTGLRRSPDAPRLTTGPFTATREIGPVDQPFTSEAKPPRASCGRVRGRRAAADERPHFAGTAEAAARAVLPRPAKRGHQSFKDAA